MHDAGLALASVLFMWLATLSSGVYVTMPRDAILENASKNAACGPP